MDAEIVDWVTSNFLPFEAELRGMLRRVCASAAEVDDVVQELYYKVLMLPSVAHIIEPRGFLFRTAKNMVIDRMRRDAVVSIEAVANLDELDVPDDAPSPERIAQARAELKWVISLIDHLPARCKAVIRARRMYGLSQSDTAETLGITEKAVEYETARGMELVSDMMARVGMQDELKRSQSSTSKRATTRNHVND